MSESVNPGEPDLVIVGAGGHGLEAYDVAREAGLVVGGFVDDGMAPGQRVEPTGLTVLGGLPWLVSSPQNYVIAVASPSVRCQLDEVLSATAAKAFSVVHPSAGVGSGVSMGSGTIVPQGCRISAGASLGRHVHLGAMCNVAHGTMLDDFVTVTPGVLVSGDCVIGAGAWLGAGCVVNQGLTIGAGATVGSGAVVVADVEPGVTVVGVPARPLPTSA